ncbi:hypothetical protein FB45DRAFT_1078938 [Roridomyces roridus]|uniref:F-box domain-containing protein n=1 Tax=Roridomyces roridus TaxID=1738132 RepID=A0AAD7G203_9AGAR|nr:hypothetical protein FB45DRAFT_1078938 [Roridomyces roridus]
MATLPPELERQIFELVAYSQPLFVPTLSLVAKRVKAWVENFLYRVVVVSKPNTGTIDFEMPCPDFRASQIQHLPPPVLRNSVRHLFLKDVPEEEARFLLSTCENLDDLSISWVYPLASLLEIAERFFRDPQAEMNEGEPRMRVDWTHALFSYLTHLERYAEHFHNLPAGLASIPNLTHLALGSGVDSLPQLVPNIFRMCGDRLRVLVFSTDGIRFRQMGFPTFIIPNWRMKAEEFVALRVAGQVERNQYIMEVVEPSWT